MQLGLLELLDMKQTYAKIRKDYLEQLKKKIKNNYTEISRKLRISPKLVKDLFDGKYAFKLLFLKKLSISVQGIWDKIISFKLKGSKKEIKLPRKIPFNEDFAWLLGYWLGDRNSAKDGIGVTDTSLEVLSKFLQLINMLNIDRKDLRIYVNYAGNPDLDRIARQLNVPRGNCRHVEKTCKALTITVMFYSRLWARIFSKIEKQVKQLLDAASPTVKGAFIGGFIDAESGYFKKSIRISQAKKKYIEILARQFKSIGIKISKVKFSHHLFYIDVKPISDNLIKFLNLVRIVNPKKRRDVQKFVYGVKHLQADKVSREQILKYMKESGSVTIRQVAENFNVSYNAAKHAMLRLRKKKLIKEVGKKGSFKLFSLAVNYLNVT